MDVSTISADRGPKKSALDLFGLNPEGRATFGPASVYSPGIFRSEAPFRNGFGSFGGGRPGVEEGVLDSVTRERASPRAHLSTPSYAAYSNMMTQPPPPPPQVPFMRSIHRASTASSSTLSYRSSGGSSMLTASSISSSMMSLDGSQPKTSSGDDNRSFTRPFAIKWSHFLASAPLLHIVNTIENVFSKHLLTYYCQRSDTIALRWEFRAISTTGSVSIYESDRAGTFAIEVNTDEGGEDVELDVLHLLESAMNSSSSSSRALVSEPSEAMASQGDNSNNNNDSNSSSMNRNNEGPRGLGSSAEDESSSLSSSSSDSTTSTTSTSFPVLLSPETTTMFLDALRRGDVASRLFTLRPLVDIAEHPSSHSSLVPFLIPIGHVLMADVPISQLYPIEIDGAKSTPLPLPLLLSIAYIYEKASKTRECVDIFCANGDSRVILDYMLQIIWIPSNSPVMILAQRNIACALCAIALNYKTYIISIASLKVQQKFWENSTLTSPTIDSTLRGLREMLKNLLM